MEDQQRAFSSTIQAVIAEIVPICHQLAEGRGRYAISIGGSLGKGTSDSRSDVDFRLFHEEDLPGPKAAPQLWQGYSQAEARWAKHGVTIDGIWPRKIAAIDAALSRWLDGEIKTEERVWTIWGYYLLPDIYHQAVVEDRFGVIAAWKQRLQSYPPKLKEAILAKYLASLRYWRNDYHYRSKVQRGDVVFTAGLTCRLVHDLIQVLFALNETYYVGDGQNLDLVARFKLAPAGFGDAVKRILYPPTASDSLQAQYAALLGLMDEVLRLAEAEGRK